MATATNRITDEQAEIVETLANVAGSLSRSAAAMEEALRGLLQQLQQQPVSGQLLSLVPRERSSRV